MAKSNDGFRASLDHALGVFTGSKSKVHNDEQFMEGTYTGYRLSQSYFFVGEDEVESRFHLKSKDLQKRLPLETLIDASGEPIAGFIFSDNSMRKVEFFCDTFTQFQETIFSPSKQLRSQQGQEIASWYRGGLKKALPKAAKSASTLDCIDQIRESLDMERKAAEAKAALETQEEQPVPPPEPPKGVLEQKPLEECESSDAEVEYAQLQGPQLKQPVQKEKKGGKKRRAHEKSAQTGGTPSAAPSRRMSRKGPLGAGESVRSGGQISDNASVATSQPAGPASTARSSDEKIDKAYRKHVEKLDIAGLLSGKPLGIWRHHARRELSGMQRANAGTVETVMLASHLDLYTRAEQILPANVKKLTRSTRMSTIEDLLSAGYTIPKHCQGPLLALAVAEAERDWEKVLDTMTPVSAPGEEFNALAPKLGSSDLSDTDKSKLLHKVFLSDVLVPLLCDGQKAEGDIKTLCAGILRKYGGVSGALHGKKTGCILRAARIQAAKKVAVSSGQGFFFSGIHERSEWFHCKGSFKSSN